MLDRAENMSWPLEFACRTFVCFAPLQDVKLLSVKKFSPQIYSLEREF